MYKDKKYYLEDYEIGQKFISPTRVVTEADIVNFGCLGGDFYPLHFDEDYAKSQGFKTRIMHGLGTLCLVGGFAYYTLPIDRRVIAHLRGEYRFPAPVYAQDTIYAEFEILNVRPSQSKPDRGVVTYKATIKNQRNEVVGELNWSFMIQRKPKG